MRQEERRGSLPRCLCPCSCNLYALLNFLNDLVTAAGGGAGGGRGADELEPGCLNESFVTFAKHQGDNQALGAGFG